MSSKSSIALAALLASGAFALPAAAAEPQEAMVVVRDANTGKLRPPTAAELRVLQQQKVLGLVKPEVEESLVTIRPNGTVHKHLGEKAMVYSVVRRDGRGKLGMQCVKGQDAADAALAQPAPATAKEHDHETR
ncbi:MAG: hypothetical protein M3R60_10055 [Pseudomonadota bacterium]|nr:hypothetical protein [Pseudomonadota bacterium]